MSLTDDRKSVWPWAETRAAVTDALRRTTNLPKISIVTPSFNQGQFIEETIRSVIRQDYPNLEYVIMDGGSRDGTVEIIKQYAGQITHWESEKDGGQSHAINKGLARCTGDIFNWINSDDLLAPGALWTVAEAWLKTPGRVISGQTEFFNDEGTFETIKASGQTLRNFVRFWEAKDWSWAQPGTFVPLADFTAVGGLRTDLKYCLDYHMMVQLLARGVDVHYLDQVLAKFRFHGDSKTVGSREQFRLERVPTLRAMKNLPIPVAEHEWDREQAKRLVDVAISAARRGKLANGMKFLAQGLRLSPAPAMREIFSRCGARWAKPA